MPTPRKSTSAKKCDLVALEADYHAVPVMSAEDRADRESEILNAYSVLLSALPAEEQVEAAIRLFASAVVESEELELLLAHSDRVLRDIRAHVAVAADHPGIADALLDDVWKHRFSSQARTLLKSTINSASSLRATKVAVKGHRHHRKLKAAAFAWLHEHPGLSIERAAQALLDSKKLPIAFSTARRYVLAWRREFKTKV